MSVRREADMIVFKGRDEGIARTVLFTGDGIGQHHPCAVGMPFGMPPGKGIALRPIFLCFSAR